MVGPQGLGEPLEMEEAGIAKSSFQVTNVGAVETGSPGEVLLRHFSCQSCFADEPTKPSEGGMGGGTRRHTSDFSLV
jgi:hypothetical protein